MRILRAILLAASVGVLHAQGLVTIVPSPPITRADGSLAQGSASISWQQFTTAFGTQVPAGSLNVNISAGVFTGAFASGVTLFPNVGATPPGTSYIVVYSLSGSPVFVRRWYVPASSSPVNIVSIEFPPQGLVGQTAIVSPAQLTQAGAIVNQPLCWNGAMWAPGNCGGGGGGGSPGGNTNSIQINTGLGTFGGVGPAAATTVLHGGAPPSFGQVVNADILNGTIDLTSKVTGLLGIVNGSTGTSTIFTSCSVVFAGANGAYQQDNTHFCWNSGTQRLGIGTSNPQSSLDIQGAAITPAQINIKAALNSNANFNITDGNGVGQWSMFANTSGIFGVRDTTHSASPFCLTPQDDVTIGGCADGLYRLDVLSSQSGGLARFWDQGPTGLTTILVKGGIGQSNVPMVTFQDSTGGIQATIGSVGQVTSTQVIASSAGFLNGASLSPSQGLVLANNRFLEWSSTSTFTGTVDTMIARHAPGFLEIDQATPGSYGSLILQNITLNGTSGAGPQCLQVDNTGLASGSGAPCSGGGGTTQPPYSNTFTGTTATITNATHNQGIHPYAFVYDSGANLVQIAQTCLNVSATPVGCADPASIGTLVLGGGSTLSGTYTYTIYGATPVGGSAGGANTALSNLSSVSINTALLPQLSIDLGSTTKPFQNLYLYGAGTFGTTYLKLTGTPTGTRTITFPDSTGTVLTTAATVTVAQGGSGAATFTAHGVLLGEGASTFAATAAGTTGQCLISNGAAADPTFQTCGTGADAALDNLSAVAINTSLLTQINVDLGSPANSFRNLYLYGSGSYGSASFKFTGVPTAARTITVPDVSGTMLTTGSLVTVPQGGTGVANLTNHGVLLGQGTSALSATGAGTAGQCLVSNGSSADPSFQLCSALGPYTQSAVNVTGTVSITAATHGRGAFAIGYCFDNGTPPGLSLCAWTRDGSGNIVFNVTSFTGTFEIH